MQCLVIGERERANLVVQLARFFCIHMFVSIRRGHICTVRLNVFLNQRTAVHPILQCCTYFQINAFVLTAGSPVLQLAGLPIMQAVTWFMQARSCRRSTRSCRLPACSCSKQPVVLFLQHYISPFLSQLYHFTAIHYLDRSRSPTMFNILLVEYSKHTCNPSLCTSS